MDDRPSLVRELAHELRDALSPIRAAIDLLRLRNFDTDVSRRMAEKVDRGLDAALAAVDAFFHRDAGPSGRELVRELRHTCPGKPDGAAHGAPGHGAAARKPGSHPALA